MVLQAFNEVFVKSVGIVQIVSQKYITPTVDIAYSRSRENGSFSVHFLMDTIYLSLSREPFSGNTRGQGGGGTEVIPKIVCEFL